MFRQLMQEQTIGTVGHHPTRAPIVVVALVAAVALGRHPRRRRVGTP